MNLNRMTNDLQKINEGKIVIIKLGDFYIAKGRDAVLLNKLINLKMVCLEKEICKVGFPINALKRYLEKIEKLDYAYVVNRRKDRNRRNHKCKYNK